MSQNLQPIKTLVWYMGKTQSNDTINVIIFVLNKFLLFFMGDTNHEILIAGATTATVYEL